jgi:hypothetical protein
MKAKLVLVVVLAAFAAGSATAAPAPLHRQERHPPSPGALLVDFGSEGHYHLVGIERGPAPNVYHVTVMQPFWEGFKDLKVHRQTCSLTLPGRNVRKELREFLDLTRQLLEDAHRQRRHRW